MGRLFCSYLKNQGCLSVNFLICSFVTISHCEWTTIVDINLTFLFMHWTAPPRGPLLQQSSGALFQVVKHSTLDIPIMCVWCISFVCKYSHGLQTTGTIFMRKAIAVRGCCYIVPSLNSRIPHVGRCCLPLNNFYFLSMLWCRTFIEILFFFKSKCPLWNLYQMR